MTTPESASRWASITQGYGPTALSIVLMLVALGLTMQAHRRSAELARMQADFVAHVSHQLKTPLSLLSAATETLQMDRVRSPERFAEYLATIHAEAATALVRSSSACSSSRACSSAAAMSSNASISARWCRKPWTRSRTACRISTIAVRRAAGRIEPACPGRPGRARAGARQPARQCGQVFRRRTRRSRVRVSSTRTEAIVDVIDRGVGIAAADQARIFERFYRTSGTHARPGFGLGLVAGARIVQAHQGRVEVTSVVGEGSTFRIVLPRSRPTRSSRTMPAPRGGPPHDRRARTHR